ncbi:glycine-rich RNA-binding protein RZ1C-like isoform X1 [Zingiber officinale]|nr:glycine-rich RNA-binding protein RZ1C-like isoform X1 [Zingiber officinale]XP_042453292.1 glycine-rich RNA-binding protein RZ1C-like isoform X1 [Zingiber officinale]
MSAKEDNRIFVGGLSRHTTERRLEEEFSRFGKVIEAQIMKERDTGRPRGFGFVTFSSARASEAAISQMHENELDGRVISVNKAEPKMSTDISRYDGGEYKSSSRGGYRGGDGPPPAARTDECFKCGRSGHWARECPSAGGGSDSHFSSHAKFGGGSDGRGGHSRYSDRYMDDRYDGGHYGDRDRFDSRDSRYGGGRDKYMNDRYGPPGDEFQGDRYRGGPDHYPHSGYNREKSYERDVPRGGSYDRDPAPRGSGGYDRDGPRGGGSDRYGTGGPARYNGGGSFRQRHGPYDRPGRGGRTSSYDVRY